MKGGGVEISLYRFTNGTIIQVFMEHDWDSGSYDWNLRSLYKTAFFCWRCDEFHEEVHPESLPKDGCIGNKLNGTI